jgi:hypothetical protein
MIDAIIPELLICVDDRFGIGIAAEDMPFCDEHIPEFTEVINLAVEGDPDSAVFVGHRLMSGRGKIDDAESSLSKCRGAIGVDPCIIRSPVHEPIAHPRQRVTIRRAAIQVNDSGYATHENEVSRIM